jgi:tetratricopeptide (TPR) repeat protein
MMDAYELRMNQRYAESIREYRKLLKRNPDNWAAVDGLSSALMATGAYAEALPLLHRLDKFEREDLPGHPGSKCDLACSYWCLDQWPTAMKLMRGLVEGILDRSIEFGDLAGGVQQGLLLHYMGVTAKDREAVAFALSYLRKLATKDSIEYWPGPLARYMLGEINLKEMLRAAVENSNDIVLAVPIEDEDDLLERRDTCVALFHDGVRHRAAGQEKLCMDRMRECTEIDARFIEPECYLARYEVERAANGVHWRADAPAAPPRQMTGEEYARMPSGAHYVHPADGTVRRKR